MRLSDIILERFITGLLGGNAMALEHVLGKNAGKIMLYALSTCIWCKKTRQLLTDLGVAYDYLYVDLMEGEERANAMSLVGKWNSDLSFPTIVINDTICIVGFKEREIREALKL